MPLNLAGIPILSSLDPLLGEYYVIVYCNIINFGYPASLTKSVCGCLNSRKGSFRGPIVSARIRHGLAVTSDQGQTDSPDSPVTDPSSPPSEPALPHEFSAQLWKTNEFPSWKRNSSMCRPRPPKPRVNWTKSQTYCSN